MWVIIGGDKGRRDMSVMAASFLLVLAWNWQLPGRLLTIVKNDTILTLSALNGSLLFVLAVGVTLCAAWGAMLKTRYLQRCYLDVNSRVGLFWLLATVGDLLLSVVAFWLSLTLAPQLFYLFYRVIIPGLPLQWVVQPMGIGEIWPLLQLHRLTILSDLGAGLLLSTVLIAVVWSWILVSPLFTSRSRR